jgi:hypothetical protein
MSSSDSSAELAAWTQPGTSFTVEYSLPLFHEIDFFLNEGYRRIPHGGIELGGLLFGRAISNGIRIEAFRPIECEHASGPSFKLSERDIAGLRKQIEDGESGLQVLGWFVAHTRSELRMNDMEAALFDELLPGPEKVTLLVKPEKFKSTRFTFLVRGANGSIERDGIEQAFVLPLPGRTARVDPVPAILAEPVAEPVLEKAPEIPQQPIIREEQREERIEERQEKPRQGRIEEPPRVFVVPTPVQPPVPALPPPPLPLQRNIPDTESRIERRRSARETQRTPSGSKLGFVLILLLAGILGCGIGYWTYLQLPSAIIPLNLQPDADGFTLSWPPELTRDAVYVAVRVNDSEPVLVSAPDRNSGHSEINVTGDNVKVELIARRWMRDSRGIVRYVR